METNAILTILGCGTSTGVPMPACPCAVCRSGDPLNYRNRSSAWLKTASGQSILIDAGPDLRQQTLNARVERLDGVLITHAHADHILGLDDLRCFNFIQRTSIPCYANAGALSDIRERFAYIFNPDPLYPGALAQLDLKEIRPYEPVKLADCEVTPFALVHGNLAALGFKIGNLAYATDCNDMPAATKELLRNCKHLVLDGLRFESHGSHYSIAEAIAVAQELNIENTYLTHLGHTVDYHAATALLPAGVRLCYDGLEIKFKY